MKDSIFNNPDLITPAYVYDQDKIVHVLKLLSDIRDKTGCFVLYSIKSANMVELLEVIKPYVDGFSCSSLFEVQLANEVLGDSGTVHITTPGYRANEWPQIFESVDFVTLNSYTQVNNHAEEIYDITSCGIRINPEMSFVKDERYDPCRTHSKLGVSINDIKEQKVNIDWQFIEGIHVHNNCESICFDELKKSIDKVLSVINLEDKNLQWFNLGGGYLLSETSDTKPLIDTVKLLSEYDTDVYFEPGKAITGQAGYLVTTVIDKFVSDNKHVAVLDTSINHLPEVFEYQYQPKLLNSVEKSAYEYRLTGCSCLSGDLFGDYFFAEPLEIGSRVVFENIGAYMQVKANMFNGINLPTTYLLEKNRNLKLLKQYDYNEFRCRL